MITANFDTKNNQCFKFLVLFFRMDIVRLPSLYNTWFNLVNYFLILDSNVMFTENEETNPSPIIGFEQISSP